MGIVLLLLSALFMKGAEELVMLANQRLQAVQLFLSGLEIIRLWNCKPASDFVPLAGCFTFL